MLIRGLLAIETGVIFARLLDGVSHGMQVIAATECEPFLGRDFIPTIEHLGAVGPHHACLQEGWLFPEGIEVIV